MEGAMDTAVRIARRAGLMAVGVGSIGAGASVLSLLASRGDNSAVAWTVLGGLLVLPSLVLLSWAIGSFRR